MACAQTNLQLFNQLRQAGYAEADLARVAAAYGLTMTLFTGQFRPSGKTFLAHLVGTASILATCDEPPEVVTAGLLHAAYASGEWGDGGPRVSWKRRSRVQDAVGTQVEDLVHRYTRLTWNARTIPGLGSRVESLDETERRIVVMRLANMLEDYLDGAMSYCRKSSDEKQAPSHQALAVDMAARLGLALLATSLSEAFQHAVDDAPPALLRAEWASFTIVPQSHWRRPDLAVRDRISTWRTWARRGVQGRGGSRRVS
ncbi:MAG: DUF6817 domain-containing protein [Acidimicrobiales bacterium]